MLSYLEGAVAEVHDDSSGGSEPRLQRRDARQLVTFSNLHVGASFQKMLFHVASEIVQQLHLLFKSGWETGEAVVVLLSFEVYVVNIAGIKQRQSLSQRLFFCPNLTPFLHEKLKDVVEILLFSVPNYLNSDHYRNLCYLKFCASNIIQNNC